MIDGVLELKVDRGGSGGLSGWMGRRKSLGEDLTSAALSSAPSSVKSEHLRDLTAGQCSVRVREVTGKLS